MGCDYRLGPTRRGSEECSSWAEEKGSSGHGPHGPFSPLKKHRLFPENVATPPYAVYLQNERVCSLVVTRVSIALEVLGLTPHGSEYSSIMLIEIGFVYVCS